MINRPLMAAIAAAAVLFSGAGAAQPASAEGLQPHRITYELSRLQVSAASPIAGVSGDMAYDLRESCEAWALSQSLDLDFAYAESGGMALSTEYTAWESKDFLEYSFLFREFVGGSLHEEFRGNVRRENADDPLVVDYTRPEAEERTFERGVLPIQHTLELFRRAEAGEMIYNAVLFDGAFEDGAVEVNAVITGRIDPPDTVENPALDRPGWRVRLAYFELEGDDQPYTEVSMRILDNGVVPEMEIYYPDFSIIAEMDELEMHDRPEC